ncbi:MAG: hypothetical protein DHS20C13_02040 [Thermodesulfobacteriota bacterium]|nr:MAG: hypothetical protein DHS20C13_02040 [Thermodesulfobacteriota bacterium]
MLIFRYLHFSLFLLVSISVFPISSALAQFQCLPTCVVDDGRHFALAGIGGSTLNNSTIEFGLMSPEGADSLQFGIFDGESEGRWDSLNQAELTFTVFADPNGDGSGTMQIAEFIGDTMADNDWSDFNIPNNPAAQTPEGDFSYRLVATNLNPNMQGRNVFKVRSAGGLSLIANQPFNIIGTMNTVEDILTIYPSFDILDPGPGCLTDLNNPLSLCDEADPSCCFNDTTYSGTWTFFFEVPEGLTTLQIWNGDFDFGSSSADAGLNCSADGIDVDTNDLNTPDDVLPPWAIGTTAVLEGLSTPTDPPDDICSPIFRRRPSVTINLFDPLGTMYTDENPSGTEEWELFSISSDEPFDPMVNDLSAAEIMPGVWRVEIMGTDIQNLNALRLEFPILGIDPGGELPTDPPPAVVPTLSQWGLVGMAGALGMFSLFFMRKRKQNA